LLRFEAAAESVDDFFHAWVLSSSPDAMSSLISVMKRASSATVE
jgi:hypothetical protein